MVVYDNFTALYEKKIKPFRNEHPDWIRLDGLIGVGNRQVFAYFLYDGQKWRIHSDTHFRMLTKAYLAIKQNNNPFTIVPTAGENKCLVLIPELAERPKYIYIYLEK